MATSARQIGDWEFAADVAKQMIAHDPAYAGTQYARGLVAERDGDRSAARTAFATAVTLWKQADADLPALLDARRRLTALP